MSVPVDSPFQAGHYLPSGASLKVKIELAHPLITANQIAAKEEVNSTEKVGCMYNVQMDGMVHCILVNKHVR